MARPKMVVFGYEGVLHDGKGVVTETWQLVWDLRKSGFHLGLFTDKPIGSDGEDYGVFGITVNKLDDGWNTKLKVTGVDIYLIDSKEENITVAKGLGWQGFKFEVGEDGGFGSCIQIRKELGVQ